MPGGKQKDLGSAEQSAFKLFKLSSDFLCTHSHCRASFWIIMKEERKLPWGIEVCCVLCCTCDSCQVPLAQKRGLFYFIQTKEVNLFYSDKKEVLFCFVDRFYIVLFSTLEQTHCACMRFYMSD